MKNKIAPYCLLLLICFSADAAEAKESDISEYLVDIGASPVSAGDLLGLNGSAITNIQSAHDLTLAISSLTSGSGKGGFGLAITPARTSIDILAMSYAKYSQDSLHRLIGAATLSYAEMSSDISGTPYKKSAFSVSSTYYPDENDDAILQAYTAFHKCSASIDADVMSANVLKAAYDKINSDPRLNEEEKSKAKEAAKKSLDTKAAEDAWKVCLKDATSNTKWNTSKLSFSFGAGWIKPEATAGASQSLGRSLVIGGIYKTGEDGATYVTLRHTRGEADLKTLAGTPTFSNSTLAAIRFTQGVGNDSTFRILAEVSNAKNSPTVTSTASNTVFKYAVGMDKKLSDGVWAEFRFGRKRTEDGTTMENASLLNLNWSPSSTLFGSK